MAGRSLAAALGAVALAVVAGCGSSDGGAADPREPTGTTAAIDLPFPEASVVCDGDTTRTGAARVEVRPDGIHLRVENTAGRALAWSADVEGAGGTGSSAPRGASDHVLDLPPGTVRVACYDERRDDPSEVPRVAIEAVDPGGLWVSTALGCTEQVSTIADYPAGARGEAGDPVDVVRARLRDRRELAAGDRVERAGYPAVTQPTRVRLVRDGEVVAVFEVARARSGGWLQTSAQTCTGVGLD